MVAGRLRRHRQALEQPIEAERREVSPDLRDFIEGQSAEDRYPTYIAMKKAEFCLPTPGKDGPDGPDWIHEVKYDGYRMRVVRSGKAVRLFSEDGLDQEISVDRGDGPQDQARPLRQCVKRTGCSFYRVGSQGIFVAPLKTGKIGPELFEAVYRMGLEGLISKHKERAYRIGRCDHWIKVKNRKHPAFTRVMESF